jgi:hypothetical protein
VPTPDQHQELLAIAGRATGALLTLPYERAIRNAGIVVDKSDFAPHTVSMRFDTETHCHCGANYQGSDHCPECGCEQYESGDCGHVSDEAMACPGCAEADPYRCECNAPCPRGLDGEDVCCGCPQACTGAMRGRSYLLDFESV